MKSKKILSMTTVLVLAVVILLSACSMEDVEYVGEVLRDIQSNVIDTTAPPPYCALPKPPIETNIDPQTTPVPQTTGNHTVCPWHPLPQLPPEDGIIETAEQLYAVLVNGDKDANYAVVAKELNMSKYTWNGMSNYSGTFDFGGCVIKGAMDPLFRSVKGATIKNLVLADSQYVYTNDHAMSEINVKTGEMGNQYFSPVICYADNVTISNVTVQSSVTVKADIWLDDSYHGGIVGLAEGDNILIENCHFNGEYFTDSMRVYLGGVAGYVSSEAQTTIYVDNPETYSVRVVNCSNTGKIVNLSFGQDSKTAGVVGAITNGAVINCANYGDVNSNDSGQTAGVVGYVGGNATYVKNCINTANVNGACFVGGVCAYANGDARYFENCINLGEIASQLKYWGGILGTVRKSEKLINCFNLRDKCENFAYHYQLKTALNVTEPNSHGDVSLTNCANLSCVEDILSAIKSVAPHVFQMSQDEVITLT